jgi:hypothetical protein
VWPAATARQPARLAETAAAIRRRSAPSQELPAQVAMLTASNLLCEAMHFRVEQDQEAHMIILGLILLILGWVLGISILWTIGIIVLIIGIVFLVLGQTGRAVGGRKYWY